MTRFRTVFTPAALIAAAVLTSGSPPGAAAPAAELDTSAESATPRATIDAPPYASEGDTETISVRFDRAIEANAMLEILTFHYPMHPELALEEDTWTHERQMRRMADVREGRAEPYLPDPDDASVRAILDVSTVETLPLSPAGDGRSFATPWKAGHGRIFFRVRLDDVLVDSVATTRGHCVHVNMNSVERLKRAVGRLETPLAHEHAEMVDRLSRHVASTYRSGHGLRHMLVHHELGTDDLDETLAHLESAVRERRWDKARASLRALEREIASREEEFVRVTVDGSTDRIRLTLQDRIKGYSFSDDPETALYLRPGRTLPGPMLPDSVLPGPRLPPDGGHDDTSGHDPSMHQAMMGFDREALIRDAIELSRVEGAFEISRDRLGDVRGPFTLIALYGDDQGYHLTRRIETEDN